MKPELWLYSSRLIAYIKSLDNVLHAVLTSLALERGVCSSNINHVQTWVFFTDGAAKLAKARQNQASLYTAARHASSTLCRLLHLKDLIHHPAQLIC